MFVNFYYKIILNAYLMIHLQLWVKILNQLVEEKYTHFQSF